MKTLDLSSDLFADLSETKEPNTHPFVYDEVVWKECPGCNGKGRYIGFRWIEDPCDECGGSGRVRVRVDRG